MIKKKIIVMNGPNLNLLGKREKAFYGNSTFSSLKVNLKSYTKKKEIFLSLFQSNSEGKLLDYLQKRLSDHDALIINAGGYSHTSVALRDCLKLFEGLIYEVHISNIYNREEFRRKSLLSEVSNGVICGAGILGYEMAIDAIILEKNW